MTTTELHNHTDVTPVHAAQPENPLGGETITDSNRTYLAAKGEGPGQGAEAALPKASISATGIDFGNSSAAATPGSGDKTALDSGKASGTTTPSPGDGTSPNPNLNPTPTPQELMNMGMNLGEFNKVPADLKPLAMALGKDGMYGLTAEQRQEEPKLIP